MSGAWRAASGDHFTTHTGVTEKMGPGESLRYNGPVRNPEEV